MTFSGWCIMMSGIKNLFLCMSLIVCIVLLTACSGVEKTLLDTDAVLIIQNGRQTCITDRET